MSPSPNSRANETNQKHKQTTARASMWLADNCTRGFSLCFVTMEKTHTQSENRNSLDQTAFKSSQSIYYIYAVLWQNSLSITGQKPEKLASICLFVCLFFYDNKLSSHPLSLVTTSHKLKVHVSVRLLTIQISQWAREKLYCYRTMLNWQEMGRSRIHR